MGFLFDRLWEPERIFEDKMLWLEDCLKESGEDALKELRRCWHKVNVTGVSEKELLEKLRKYDLHIIIFPDREWNYPYAEISTNFRGQLLDFRSPERLQKYFSILDKFIKN